MVSHVLNQKKPPPSAPTYPITAAAKVIPLPGQITMTQMFPEAAAAEKPSTSEPFGIPMKPNWAEVKHPVIGHAVYYHKLMTAIIFSCTEMWTTYHKEKEASAPLTTANICETLAPVPDTVQSKPFSASFIVMTGNGGLMNKDPINLQADSNPTLEDDSKK